MDSGTDLGGHGAAGLGLEAEIESIRRDFPLLSRAVGGHPLTYLDNAATSQKPASVIAAIEDYYRRSNANVHRALHTIGEESTALYEGARRKVAAFIAAPSHAEVVFTRGTTESINLVANSWGAEGLGEGDIVLLTAMEHHANIVPWQLLRARLGFSIRVVPLETDGSLDLERLAGDWDERIRLFALTHSSNVLGTINDVQEAATLAHAHGALCLVDAAQSVPHHPIDVKQLGCDFLAFSGHKAYGPMGIGVLWARESLLEAMPPWMGGGDMIRSVSFEESTWNDLPWKFEAGTPNVEGAVGLGAAIDYLDALGPAHIARIESALAAMAMERLSAVEGLTIHGKATRREPLFSFTLDGVHPHDLAQYLDREGIAVRAGHHCAQPLMKVLGVPATARASLAFYNLPSEIDRLCAGIGDARRFWS